METFLQIVTLPGYVVARLLYDFKAVSFLLFIGCVLAASIRIEASDKPPVGGFLLVFLGILFPMLPGLTGFYRLESPIFIVCVLSGVVCGWLYGYHRFRLQPNRYVLDFDISNTGGWGNKKNWNIYVISLLVLFSLAFLIRTAGINQYPEGFSYWELDRGLQVIKYDKGEKDLSHFLSLFKGSQSISAGSPFMLGLSAVFYKIFGVSLVTGRFVSVFLSLAGLLFLYLFLRSYFSISTSFFLMIFPSLELSNVVFGRTGFNYISAFTFATGILFFFQRTFHPGRCFPTAAKAVLFSIVLYCSIYMYYPARVMVPVIGLLVILNTLKSPGFLKANILPLILVPVTLVLILFIHVNGNILKLWPGYAGYINPSESRSVKEFVETSGFVLFKNAVPAIKRIAFDQKAPDSKSRFSEGGLLSKPALLLVPFALGFLISHIKERFIISLLVILIFSSLPALLSGVPNSRRLLLFNSFLLILPGVTLAIIWSGIGRYYSDQKALSFLILGTGLIFSYNLFIFWDVNKNMSNWPTRYMPFAESGFGDVNFSEFKRDLAREVNGLLETGDVYVYFSFTHDEPAFGPNGTFEQMLIQGYPRIKKGARLRWMNPFCEGFQPHPGKVYDRCSFSGYPELKAVLLESGRPVHVMFVKPLADELGILFRLREEFPKAAFREKKGNAENEIMYLVTVSPEMGRALYGSPRQEKVKMVPPWKEEGKYSYVHPYSADRLSLKNPDRYLYSQYSNVFDQDGNRMTPGDDRAITRIIEKQGKYYILRGDYGMGGYLTIYDKNFSLMEDITLHGYPFDGFWGPGGELYITYLEYNGIGILRPDGKLELWETSEFSDLPVWNGIMDGEGDFILISAGKTAYILDSRRRLKRSFPVDISWNVHPDILRDRGGIVSLGKEIFMLNSDKNRVVGYNKKGERLVSQSGDTLFTIPEDFRIAFLEEDYGIIYLINRGEPRFILRFRSQMGSPPVPG